ncbi:MAG: hypothetical protein M3314_12975 [Actinomycetota bacterium]|nr:hypothetical protein [Actinomycetota bacterium]
MAGFAYLCALLLAAAFVRAAAAKLARPEQTEAGFRALDLPRPALLARAVPVLEVLVATLLVAAPAPGGVVAFVLLSAFTVVLARAVGAGLTTGCTCFGAVSAEPVSRSDLLRNALLAAAAVAAWQAPGPTLPSAGAVALLAVALVAGTVLLRFSRGRRGQAQGSR